MLNEIMLNDIMLNDIVMNDIVLSANVLNVVVPNLRQNHIFLFQFGRFTCKCLPGYGDRFSDDEDRSGRYCESWCQRHKTFFSSSSTTVGGNKLECLSLTSPF
jgi:hypothetical protein